MMPTMIRNRLLRSTTGLVVIAVCIVASITLILAYRPQIEHQRQQISLHQQQRSHHVIEKINDTFDTIHQQILNLNILTAQQQNNPQAIENTLKNLLQASSPNEILAWGFGLPPSIRRPPLKHCMALMFILTNTNRLFLPMNG